MYSILYLCMQFVNELCYLPYTSQKRKYHSVNDSEIAFNYFSIKNLMRNLDTFLKHANEN